MRSPLVMCCIQYTVGFAYYVLVQYEYFPFTCIPILYIYGRRKVLQRNKHVYVLITSTSAVCRSGRDAEFLFLRPRRCAPRQCATAPRAVAPVFLMIRAGAVATLCTQILSNKRYLLHYKIDRKTVSVEISYNVCAT